MIFKPLPPYAGTLELSSGRWAWIAFDRGDFVHVNFQHLDRIADLMESTIDKLDFAEGAIEELGRAPAVRWWHDRTADIIWELRLQQRDVPARIPGFARRELIFFHIGMEPRRVLLPMGSQLGELTDEQIRFLARSARPDTVSTTRPDRGNGQVGTA